MLLQCCIFIVRQIKLTVVVVVVAAIRINSTCCQLRRVVVFTLLF